VNEDQDYFKYQKSSKQKNGDLYESQEDDEAMLDEEDEESRVPKIDFKMLNQDEEGVGLVE
jgi:hypothetical protein